MKYTLFIGRWAPFHEGHKNIINSFIKNGHSVCIAIRDTPLSEDDPFSIELRKKLIEKVYEGNPRVKVIEIPDIETVAIGRDVGYSIVQVPENISIISGTEKRKTKAATWNGGKGKIIWLTGLPCSGKTTIAYGVAAKLSQDFQILDGDLFRKIVTPYLGFSEEDRKKNLETAFHIAKTLYNHGVIVICAFVSPMAVMIDKFKIDIGDDFKIVYVKCRMEECIRRDVKGMWSKALRGEIKGFTGYDAVYESPHGPDLIIDSEHELIQESIDKVRGLIE